MEDSLRLENIIEDEKRRLVVSDMYSYFVETVKFTVQYRQHLKFLRGGSDFTEFPCHCWRKENPKFLYKISYRGIFYYICEFCDCVYSSYSGRDIPSGRDRMPISLCRVEGN